MRSFDELERMWSEQPAPPVGRGTVRVICLRLPGGGHDAPARAALSPDGGVHGDRWAADADRVVDYQVTLMMDKVRALIASPDQPADIAGDNFLVELDLGEDALPVGARIRLGTALLEVTPEPHTGCKTFSARFGQDALRWVNWKDHRARRLRGVNCKVIEAGEVAVGDAVEVVG